MKINKLKLSLIITTTLLIFTIILLKFQYDDIESIKSQNRNLKIQLMKLNPYTLKDTLEIIELVIKSELNRELKKDNHNWIYVELYPFLDYLNSNKYNLKIPNVNIMFILGNPLHIHQGGTNYLIFPEFKINLDSTAMIVCAYGKYYRSMIFLRKSEKWKIERSIFHE